MITSILKSIDTFVIIATTSSSYTLSLTGIGVVAISNKLNCNSTIMVYQLANKVKKEIILNKYNKYREQYHKDQELIKPFDNLYRISLRDNVIDKNEYESLCNIFAKYLVEQKMNLFYKREHKNKS